MLVAFYQATNGAHWLSNDHWLNARRLAWVKALTRGSGGTPAARLGEPRMVLPSRATTWPSDDLKFYWQTGDLDVVPQDMQYSEKGMTEAMERTAQGDEAAQLHLLRAIKCDPDSEIAQQAQEILKGELVV